MRAARVSQSPSMPAARVRRTSAVTSSEAAGAGASIASNWRSAVRSTKSGGTAPRAWSLRAHSVSWSSTNAKAERRAR